MRHRDAGARPLAEPDSGRNAAPAAPLGLAHSDGDLLLLRAVCPEAVYINYVRPGADHRPHRLVLQRLWDEPRAVDLRCAAPRALPFFEKLLEPVRFNANVSARTCFKNRSSAVWIRRGTTRRKKAGARNVVADDDDAISRTDFLKLTAAASRRRIASSGIAARKLDVRSSRIPTDAAAGSTRAAPSFASTASRSNSPMGTGGRDLRRGRRRPAELVPQSVSVFSAYGCGFRSDRRADFDLRHRPLRHGCQRRIRRYTRRAISTQAWGRGRATDIYVSSVRVARLARRRRQVDQSRRAEGDRTTGRTRGGPHRPRCSEAAVSDGHCKRGKCAFSAPLDVIAPVSLSCWVATVDYIAKNTGLSMLRRGTLRGREVRERASSRTIDLVAQFSVRIRPCSQRRPLGSRLAISRSPRFSAR